MRVAAQGLFLAMLLAQDEAAAIPSSEHEQYPPLLAALEEQVGLKIEQRKVPAEVLVIDRATLPSGN
jgi:uncharacterized protein (TIGR03435 family)